MSGSLLSTGRKTTCEDLEIKELYKLEIESLVIHGIPLFTTNIYVNIIRFFGCIAQHILPPMISLDHYAIQLNLKNGNVIIAEYGQYFTDETDIEKIKSEHKIASCCNSWCDEPREDNINQKKWYINRDGIRLIRIKGYSPKDTKKISKFIAENFYGKQFYEKLSFFNAYVTEECYVNNKITLGDLCEKFKGENWEAKNYNLITHNCQHFSAEIIRILKATREKYCPEYRKFAFLKVVYAGPILKALYDNENEDVTKIITNVPVVSLLYDGILLSQILINKKKDA